MTISYGHMAAFCKPAQSGLVASICLRYASYQVSYARIVLNLVPVAKKERQLLERAGRALMMELVSPPPWTNETIADASKKDIVVYLQANMAADEDFLKKHKLKGQEKAIIKGSKIPALRKAYAEFLELVAAAAPEPEPEPGLELEPEPEPEPEPVVRTWPGLEEMEGPVILNILSFLSSHPLDRIRIGAVSKSLRKTVVKHALMLESWRTLDFSKYPAVAKKVTNHGLKLIAAMTGGGLQYLDVSGCFNTSRAVINQIARRNKGLLEITVRFELAWTVSQTTEMLDKIKELCPNLRKFTVDIVRFQS